MEGGGSLSYCGRENWSLGVRFGKFVDRDGVSLIVVGIRIVGELSSTT